MVVIYRGFGFLALVTFPFAFMMAAFAFDAAFGTNTLSRQSLWPPLAAGLLAGALTWALGRLLNREPLEVTVYEVEGPRTTLEPKHTLYWVRMEYWGPIFFAFVVAGFLFL